MAKEQQYIQQLTDLGVYDPAFDGAIHVLCIQERELSRAMKAWKATAPDPKPQICYGGTDLSYLRGGQKARQ